ncbi:hypothetical protein B0H12DRAFT_1081483 [Mycena haematopus]|nr:hypothetical protein B0H12DRAFT_1081483 [Mycena haematopus]
MSGAVDTEQNTRFVGSKLYHDIEKLTILDKGDGAMWIPLASAFPSATTWTPSKRACDLAVDIAFGNVSPSNGVALRRIHFTCSLRIFIQPLGVRAVAGARRVRITMMGAIMPQELIAYASGDRDSKPQPVFDCDLNLVAWGRVADSDSDIVKPAVEGYSDLPLKLVN